MQSFENERILACRDIKPENLMVQHIPIIQDGNLSKIHTRLIDFGSAVDPFSATSMYGETGPSELQHTQEYAPPEALLAR